jgi:hypothetical protein
MSTRVVGIVPADENYKKMLQVYDVCESAGIEPPVEVMEFFNYDTPSRDGMEVHIDAVEVNSVEMQDAFVVDLKTLPKKITKIKFINSY